MQQFARAGDGFARELCRKRRRQACRHAGLRQRLGEQKDISRPEPDTAVTASISASSSIHSTAPVAASSRCASSRCAASASRGTATVMPRPIAAGVFGMARTKAHGRVKRVGEELQRPPGHDRDHDRRSADQRRERRHRLARRLAASPR